VYIKTNIHLNTSVSLDLVDPIIATPGLSTSASPGLLIMGTTLKTKEENMAKTLDMTTFTGHGLFKAIVKEVKASEGELPNRLLVTPHQFKLLKSHLDIVEDPSRTYDRLLFTEYNCMDVEIATKQHITDRIKNAIRSMFHG
jgi:hypothetical protein